MSCIFRRASQSGLHNFRRRDVSSLAQRATLHNPDEGAPLGAKRALPRQAASSPLCGLALQIPRELQHREVLRVAPAEHQTPSKLTFKTSGISRFLMCSCRGEGSKLPLSGWIRCAAGVFWCARACWLRSGPDPAAADPRGKLSSLLTLLTPPRCMARSLAVGLP